MRTTMIAPGSRGDVEPYLALGKGLIKAGHSVRLVSHQDFVNFVREHDVDFWPLPGSVQNIAQNGDMRRLLEGGNFIAILSQMAQEARNNVLEMTRVGLEACQGVDLIVAGIGGLFSGIAIAEKLEIPLLQAYYIPFTPTKAYPSFILPTALAISHGGLNRMSYAIARQMIWQGFRSADRLARRDVLELPPAPFWGPFDASCLNGHPILYGYSPAVLPRPTDWAKNIHVTGYWFLDADEKWTPPEALVNFLRIGSPPIFIGFGSMSSSNPEQTAEIILRALAETGQRAILLAGWGGLHLSNLPETVFPVDSVPYSWLFPRMAAVVHHGGAGTTAAGLRAGVPSIVIPFFGDQPFWGRRVAEMGVGPQPISRRKLNVERLAEAISKVVNDQEMRQRALDLGRIIQAEEGIAKAIAVIEQFG